MDFSPFEVRIGKEFRDKRLLEAAFTHRSYLNENRRVGAEHNERLRRLLGNRSKGSSAKSRTPCD